MIIYACTNFHLCIYQLIYYHMCIYIEIYGHNVYEDPPCHVVWFTLSNIKGVKLCVCIYICTDIHVFSF